MTHLDRVAPGLVHHIDYAAMVGDPEPHLRGELAHLGLDWDPAALAFHKLDRVVRTPSREQVPPPPNRDGMEVWRHVAEWIGPLREIVRGACREGRSQTGEDLVDAGTVKKK